MTTHTSNVSVPGWTADGGFAQIVFAIYALLNLAWDNLDETGALFWKTFIRTISEVLDAVRRPLRNLYKKRNSSSCSRICNFSYVDFNDNAINVCSIISNNWGGSNFILGAVIVYGMASIFNIIVP